MKVSATTRWPRKLYLNAISIELTTAQSITACGA